LAIPLTEKVIKTAPEITHSNSSFFSTKTSFITGFINHALVAVAAATNAMQMSANPIQLMYGRMLSRISRDMRA
jgi:hypothetical protein